jgi:hypothetical protein
LSLDHERIEELLAGYVLLSLSGEDAIEADRLLSEHVPTCPMCRETLAGFQAVVGELPLAAPAARVPDLVLPRIHRGMTDTPARGRRGMSRLAVAASVAALVGMAGFSISLSGRASKAEEQRGRLLDVLSAIGQPGASPVSLRSQSGGTGGLVEVSGPTFETMYIYGEDVPDPAPGYEYQLWLGSGGTFQPIGDPFRPEDGIVLLELLNVDTSRFDEIWITEELEGSHPSAPSVDGAHSWHNALAA